MNVKIDKNIFSQRTCLYFPNFLAATHSFSVRNMPPEIYEALISAGYRRNSFYFYKNICQNCKACVPIRVDVRRFMPSKSQRRVLRKNQDLRIIRHGVRFDEKGFLLYQKYCAARHDSYKGENNYKQFLIDSAIPSTEMMRYYAGTRLIAIGWIDVLPHSLSSVYFAFDPEFSSRSPGVFSVLKEIELCKALKKEWLHLGFWIKENRKMSYKNRYKPCQLLINGEWEDF